MPKRGCGRNLGRILFVKVVYTPEQRARALAVYRRTQSVTKTVRVLGYPGRWTLYSWLRNPQPKGRKPRRRRPVKRYSLETKIGAVELFEAGWRPEDIARELDLTSKMSVYPWVRSYRESGRWGLMSPAERRRERQLPTRRSLENSLPDDPRELKALAASLLVDKAVLEQELELVKKDASVTPGALSNRDKARVVDALREYFPLPELLRSTGLSSSSFYYQMEAMSRPDKHATLRQLIKEIAKTNFYTYGYRRIWFELRHLGIVVSEKIVRRLMSEEGIRVRFAKKKLRYSSYEGEISPAPPNLVRRCFQADQPNRLWLTDISVFAANNGRLYLSAIIDCYDGMVVGYRTSRHPTMELVEDSLKDAIHSQGITARSRLVLHSDRGAHYRGRSWLGLTNQLNITRSMSRKGCSPDNAACEGFFGRMKVEMYHGYKWETTEKLARAIDKYISWYNNQRIKTSLGGQSIANHRLQAVP